MSTENDEEKKKLLENQTARAACNIINGSIAVKVTNSKDVIQPCIWFFLWTAKLPLDLPTIHFHRHVSLFIRRGQTHDVGRGAKREIYIFLLLLLSLSFIWFV